MSRVEQAATRWNGNRPRRVGRLAAGVTAAVLSVGLAAVAVPSAAAATTSGSTVAAAAGPATHRPATIGSGRRSAAPVCPTAVGKDMARCFAMVMQTDGVVPHSAAPTGLTPSDVQDAYKLPAGGGAGMTVGIVVAYDGPTAVADLAHYRQQFGLPALADGQFTKLDQRGGTTYPTPDAGWAGEAALDADAITAVAPQADIVLVEADSPSFEDLGEAVNTAVAAGADVVNNSYGTNYTATPGSGEDSSVLPVDAQYYDHPGVAIVASTGDDDYGVSFPASSNHVTAVGGTALVKDTSARGWTESVWHNSYGGPGSGCSIVFDKPAWQHDSGCAKRAVADVSAVADPETGLAVYYTYGGGQWSQYGGTSLSSPLVSGIYALAGKATPNTYPASYPYAKTGALFDVTTGANGTCTPAYLCTAAAGYDGPTGLGTPNGITAFSQGDHGQVKGTVTDAATHKPIAGAEIAIPDKGSATTAADGTYSLDVAPGTYTMTVAAYGYKTVTRSGVTVTKDDTTTVDVALTAAAVHTISGRVTDGSGHGYPLYSRIDVNGMPGGPVYTDPYDGTYAVDLPQGSSFDLTFTSIVPGYLPQTRHVTIGSTDRVVNTALKIDASQDSPTGYIVKNTGTTQTFDGTTAPTGWTVTDTKTPGWVFNDPGKRGNLTGGTGGFAIVDSDKSGTGTEEDSYLTSPAYDLSKATAPTLTFDTYYKSFSNSTATVQVSADGGTTWSDVWSASTSTTSGHVKIALPAMDRTATVKVRFHYTGKFAYYWEVDNVFVGNRQLAAVHGGLLEGVATDNNTQATVKGVKVTSDADATINAVTVPTGDPAVGDGFYWLFSPLTGNQPFTAAKAGYAADHRAPNVRANLTTHQDFTMKAGQLSVTPGSIDKTVAMGTTAQQTLTFANTGTEPVNVKLGEGSGGFVMQTPTGAPRQAVRASVFTGSAKARAARSTRSVVPHAATSPHAAGPSADAWTNVADLPTLLQDSTAVTVDGTVYSIGGYTGTDDTNKVYAFDAQAGSWSEKAASSDTREAAASLDVNGKVYVSGGWGADGSPDGKTEIYDPAGDSWSTGAVNPKPHSAAGRATLDGKIYLVGGCDTATCGSSDVQVYDPATDAWSSAAAYPTAIAWEACGALAQKLYCAGGSVDDVGVTQGYVYDPAADAWSPIADLPSDLWGSFSTTANGQLLIAGGVAEGSTVISNAAYAFDPASDAWSTLPNLNTALYRGSGALGFYAVGGNPGGSTTPPVKTVQLLAGYDQGGDTDVPWLSVDPTTLTIAPGAKATATVTLDASDPSIAQPGTYTAAVTVQTDTPYATPAVDVTMVATPPSTWGKITGTVTGKDAKGNVVPLAGATVELDSWAQSFTLTTDKDGHYGYWLDRRNNPLTAIVAKDGYKPQTARITVVAKQVVTKNWALIKK